MDCCVQLIRQGFFPPPLFSQESIERTVIKWVFYQSIIVIVKLVKRPI